MDIFENLGSKLNQVGNDASKKLKTMQTVSELNNRNSKLKNSISELFSRLGMEYYNAYCDDATAQFADIIANITVLNRQYAENSAQIQRLKAIVVCNACGAEVPKGYLFCPKCGTRIEVRAAAGTAGFSPSGAAHFDEARTAVQLCPKCGNDMRPGAKFCTQCGFSIV